MAIEVPTIKIKTKSHLAILQATSKKCSTKRNESRWRTERNVKLHREFPSTNSPSLLGSFRPSTLCSHARGVNSSNSMFIRKEKMSTVATWRQPEERKIVRFSSCTNLNPSWSTNNFHLFRTKWCHTQKAFTSLSTVDDERASRRRAT